MYPVFVTVYMWVTADYRYKTFKELFFCHLRWPLKPAKLVEKLQIEYKNAQDIIENTTQPIKFKIFKSSTIYFI